jgi:SAM-dependent methyltransferase
VKPDLAYIGGLIPPGDGWALDLGGGGAELRQFVEPKGYTYLNADLEPSKKAPAAIVDAHRLPFANKSFSPIVSRDALEHFWHPFQAMEEVVRVARPGATLVLHVPFMFPFHGANYFRYPHA